MRSWSCRRRRIQQMGPPLEIYRTPATAFVAEFIGTSNLMNVKVIGDQ